MATMIGMLEIVKNELKKASYQLHDQVVSARLEMSPVFYKGPTAVGRNESKINVVLGKFEMQ